MTDIISQIWSWLGAHEVIALWLGFGLLSLLLGERSRVDAWCNAHPRVAAIIKLVRGLGLDPWHLVATLQLLVRGRLPASQAERVQKAVDVVTKVVIVLLLLSFTGCAGSFEEARLARAPLRSASPPTARCISLDSQHRTWGAIGKGAAVLAGAEGIATWPVNSHDAQVGLAVGAGLTAAVAATAVYVSEDAGSTWVRECGQ